VQGTIPSGKERKKVFFSEELNLKMLTKVLKSCITHKLVSHEQDFSDKQIAVPHSTTRTRLCMSYKKRYLPLVTTMGV